MYLVKTPKLVQRLLPGCLWRMDTPERVLYLTFDDGPIPEVTPWVLDTLARFNARGTFFCVGDNVRRYPAVYARLLAEGHAVGNHTFHHLDGRRTGNRRYFRDVQQCARLVHSPLFRPPYGSLTFRQGRALEKRYRIVMWDVLSGDFDPALSPVQCLRQVMEKVERGSIVVFHDSLKAAPRLYHALPRLLEDLSAQGWRFEALQA